MTLVYTNHLKTRLKERGINLSLVKEVFEKAGEWYWDRLRKHHIAIAYVSYKGKRRKVLAAYDKIGENIEVITLHPITEEQIGQRVASRRWKHEETKS